MPVETRLTWEQKGQARELWAALMFAPSQIALEEGREALKVAPFEVRSAILDAQIDLWR
jgi:hypothetical protein